MSRAALAAEREKIIRLGMQQKDAIDRLRADRPSSPRIKRMERELHKLRVVLHGINEELRAAEAELDFSRAQPL